MAIALDATSSGTSGSSSITVAHTVTGANAILIVSASEEGSGAGDNGSCTYNGNAMTKLDYNAQTNCNFYSFYILISAPDGLAHNIVFSFTSGTDLRLAAVSYNGVDQTALGAGAHNKSGNSTAQTTLTGTITAVTGSRTVLACGTQGTGLTASTGATLRIINQSGSLSAGVFDSVATGSVSETVTFSSARWGYSIITFIPVVITLTAAVGTFALTGFAATLAKTKTLVAAVGVFLLTGNAATLLKVLNKWTADTKHTTNWTADNKH